MANAKRLQELSMPTELAREVASQIGALPTATARGGVLQQPAITNLAAGADLVTTVSKVNAIIAALRAAGIIAT